MRLILFPSSPAPALEVLPVPSDAPPARGLLLQVGDVVSVGRACLGNPRGARAVVVEIYNLGDGPSPSLLFQNGAHDGFSPRDLEVFDVRIVAHLPPLSRYQFRSAIDLFADWCSGHFAAVWSESR